jgi:ferredoxin-NADP reductase
MDQDRGACCDAASPERRPVPAPGSLPLRVQQLTHEAEGVVSARLVDPTGRPLPEWTPGAHLDLVLPSGLVRQYSLCGDPDDSTGYRVAVLRQACGRGGSIEVHDRLRVGMVVDVRGPRNHFELVEAQEYVLIAGGIGVTPLLSMARRLAGWRPFRLHYGGRSRQSMAFVAELQALADGGAVTICPQDEQGHLDLDGILAQVHDHSVVYCCGPSPLLDAVQDRCAVLGITARLHVERFSASAAGMVEVARSTSSGGGFDVELARTGTSVRVEPGVTVLQALRSVVPDLPSSCEQGICGSCEVRVLGGRPEHHDEILSDAERERGDCMFVCVSRSRTPTLLLDL